MEELRIKYLNKEVQEEVIFKGQNTVKIEMPGFFFWVYAESKNGVPSFNVQASEPVSIHPEVSNTFKLCTQREERNHGQKNSHQHIED